jgi:gluconolactonase
MPIEQLSPELERIVSRDQDVEVLGTGFGFVGDPFQGAGPAEGPLWWEDGGYLLFTDIGHNRMMKWSEGEGVTPFREPTNNANGLTRDLQGRLIACEHMSRRVTRQEPDGSITVVANRYQDRRLNRPNDVVVKSDGGIYFTDPGAPNPGLDLDFSGVYRVSPDLGTITLLVRDFVVPNGLAFSLDESVLYIDDTSRGHIRVFDVLPGGMLALGTDRVFCEIKGERPGLPDGMKLDVEGNVYCTGPGGVWIFAPSGRHLGTIVLGGEVRPTNVAWGGDDLRTLFITCWHELARIRLKIPGLPVPRKDV